MPKGEHLKKKGKKRCADEGRAHEQAETAKQERVEPEDDDRFRMPRAKLESMNKEQLEQYSMRTFGRRPEEASKAAMLERIRQWGRYNKPQY